MGRARRRWLRWSLAAIIVAGGAAWFTRPMWRGVETVTVSPRVGEVAQTVVSSGRVLAPAEIQVAVVLLGQVATVEAAEGDRVETGQLLVTLDPTEHLAAVARAEAALEGARARRQALEARLAPDAREGLAAARARRDQARRDAQRTSALAQGGARTEAEREQATTALALAESELRRALTQVRAVGPDGADAAALDAAEAEARAGLDVARARLAQTRITAPVDGVVRARRVEPGEVAQPGAPLLVIDQAGPARLVIDPDERNLRSLALGQPARASADAFPDARFDAQVSWIGPAVDRRRGTIEVRLTASAPPAGLLPDMTISVEIELERRASALTVPRAVIRDLATDAPWVLVVEGDRAARRVVALGLRGDEVVEVTEGLTVEDRVIPPGAASPTEGARVLARGGE